MRDDASIWITVTANLPTKVMKFLTMEMKGKADTKGINTMTQESSALRYSAQLSVLGQLILRIRIMLIRSEDILKC